MRYKVTISFKSGNQIITDGDEFAKDGILRVMDSLRSTITFQNKTIFGMKLRKKEIEYILFEQLNDLKGDKNE